jgi:hypothetical protein
VCFGVLLSLISPRLLIAVLFFFSDYLSRAYHSFVWPLLGFFFLPWTTLAYAFAINAHGSVTGIYLVAVVAAVLVDIGAVGGGGRYRRRFRLIERT